MVEHVQDVNHMMKVTDDEEQAPETLPLVSRNADTIDTDTDSDDSDHAADT